MFDEIGDAMPGTYNLAFGDKDLVTGELDDRAVSNNGDTDKVLATVVAALYAFFELYPEASVFATGSNPARTRLYRMGITRFYEEMRQDFQLSGRTAAGFFDFELDTEYDAFLARRKS